MVERYPNIKEEVGGLIPGCDISSLLDIKTCEVINCLLCFGARMSAFCLKKKQIKKPKTKKITIFVKLGLFGILRQLQI